MTFSCVTKIANKIFKTSVIVKYVILGCSSVAHHQFLQKLKTTLHWALETFKIL